MLRGKTLALMTIMALLLTVFTLPGALAEETDWSAAAAADTNFNATGFPIVNEPVTKTVLIRRPPNIGDVETMATFQKLEELTNVKIDWVVVSSDGWDDRINLTMASNDLPDAIIKGVPNITRASADGSIIPLNDLINEFAPGIRALFDEYPAVEKASTSPDGKLYTVPQVNTLEPNRTSHRNIWINQTLLDALGLEMPTTTDEFLDVLRAFRDRDPNGNGLADEIPYVVEDSGGQRTGRPDIIASFFGLYPNMPGPNNFDYVQVKDGQVSILKTDPVWKEVLEYMNIMWNEGLLDNEVFTQSPDASLGKFSNGNSGAFGLSSDDLFSTISSNYAPMPPVKSPNGNEPVIGLGPVHAGNAAVITKADESPWITTRWLDVFYTVEGSQLIGGLGEEMLGITSQLLDDGSYEYADYILNDERGVAVAVGEMCPLPGGGFSYWRNDLNSNYIYSAFVKNAVPAYQPYYQKDPAYGYPTFDVETAEKVNDIRRDLDVYIKECQAKFITGEMGFDQWDTYVEMTKKMGADELVGYFQEALEGM